MKHIAFLTGIVWLSCTAWIGGHEYNLLPEPGLNVWVIGAMTFLIAVVALMIILAYNLIDD